MNTSPPDIGQTAPDFELLTHTGEKFRLSEALSSGENLLLVFYRGYW